MKLSDVPAYTLYTIASRSLFILALITLSILLGYSLMRAFFDFTLPIRTVHPEASWIQADTPQTYSGCFRKTIHFTETPKQAWVLIAARDAYEITINGNTVSRSFLYRPTRPLQNGLSERGQIMVYSTPLLMLNYPREYQWDGHETYRFPIYIDILPFLKKGTNILAVEIETRTAPAKFLLDGEITFISGNTLNLKSDSSWRAEPTGLGANRTHWSNPDFKDDHWRPALLGPPPPPSPRTEWPQEGVY
ncbi:MAG: hypothetical protein AAF558_09270 [Verrucomicrobiota bacterium]